MVIRIVDRRHHRVASSSARSRRGTIVGERHIEPGWDRGRRGRLGGAIKGGRQITQGDGGRCLADHERAGGSSLVTRLVDGCHHCVAASSARSGRGTIVSQRDIEPGWDRGHRGCLGRAIEGGSQITQGDRGCRIANHERAGGSALVIRIVDGRHHRVAAKSARSGRGTIVSQRDIETGWDRGHRGCLGRAIKGGSQISQVDRGGGLADHKRACRSSGIIHIVNDSDHRVAASRSRCGGGAIVGHVHGEASRDRGE